MGNLGFQELLLILVIALIVFGPRKLPELGKSLGRGLAEFRKASTDLKNAWEEEVRLEELKKLEKAASPAEDFNHHPTPEASHPKEEVAKPQPEEANKPKTVN
jgi:Tat protein translocase TatB subunit